MSGKGSVKTDFPLSVSALLYSFLLGDHHADSTEIRRKLGRRRRTDQAGRRHHRRCPCARRRPGGRTVRPWGYDRHAFGKRRRDNAVAAAAGAGCTAVNGGARLGCPHGDAAALDGARLRVALRQTGGNFHRHRPRRCKNSGHKHRQAAP